MKFTVSSSALLSLLSTTGKVINSKNTLPILDYFLMDLKDGELKVHEIDDTLENILAKYLGLPKVTLIQCAGGDTIAAEREQCSQRGRREREPPGRPARRMFRRLQRGQPLHRRRRRAHVVVQSVQPAFCHFSFSFPSVASLSSQSAFSFLRAFISCTRTVAPRMPKIDAISSVE